MVNTHAAAVENDGEGCVGEECHGDGGVLEVVEVVGGDGSIGVERLVAGGADEEFHCHRGGSARHDEEELQVFEVWSREPWWTVVSVGVENVKLYVVEEVPQTNYEEAKTWNHVSHQGAHGIARSL